MFDHQQCMDLSQVRLVMASNPLSSVVVVLSGYRCVGDAADAHLPLKLLDENLFDSVEKRKFKKSLLTC